MGKSYPDRTNATGVWKISDIYRSRTTDGTYPDHSKSRMLVHGGSTPTKQNTIDFVEIPTTGNATDFGDLTAGRKDLTGTSDGSRGIFGGGYDGSGASNIIDYVTIASTGNATDFGDLTVGRYQFGACSSTTRGIFFGGNDNSNSTNVIDYVTIATTGNATDFGDTTGNTKRNACCSNGERGVSGG